MALACTGTVYSACKSVLPFPLTACTSNLEPGSTYARTLLFLPAASFLTACAIANAITQSSCAPLAAPMRAPGCETKVRHSSSRRLLRNISGFSTSSALKLGAHDDLRLRNCSWSAIRATPSWLLVQRSRSVARPCCRCASTPWPWLLRSTTIRAGCPGVLYSLRQLYRRSARQVPAVAAVAAARRTARRSPARSPAPRRSRLRCRRPRDRPPRCRPCPPAAETKSVEFPRPPLLGAHRVLHRLSSRASSASMSKQQSPLVRKQRSASSANSCERKPLKRASSPRRNPICA